jgi:hypothetical protein
MSNDHKALHSLIGIELKLMQRQRNPEANGMHCNKYVVHNDRMTRGRFEPAIGKC